MRLHEVSWGHEAWDFDKCHWMISRIISWWVEEMDLEYLGCRCLLVMHQLNGLSCQTTQKQEGQKANGLLSQSMTVLAFSQLGSPSKTFTLNAGTPLFLTSHYWTSFGLQCPCCNLSRFSASVMPFLCLTVKGQRWSRTQACCLHAWPLQMGNPLI